MPSNFVRPSLVEIRDRVWSDIIGAVTGLHEWYRRTVEYGIAVAVSGQTHGLHGHIAWGVDQRFVQFAEEAALLRMGDQRGVPRNAAAAATGNGTVTGAGGDITEGTLLQREDGWTYEAADSYVGLAPPATIAIRAAEGFEGAEGNLSAGQTLSWVSPPSGFDSTVTIATGGLTGGAPLEDLEDYRERLHDHMRNPVLAGRPGDHKRWALEVSGVTRAWEYKGKNGVGNPAFGRVGITFVMDDSEDIIPDAGMVETVRAHVQSKSTAEVIVFAPVAVPFDYELSALSPNTQAVRDSIESEVADMVRRESEPGLSIRLSKLDEAISIADGEDSHTLETDEDPVVEFGEILVPGTATFPI